MCGRVRLSSDVSEIKLVFSIPTHRPTPNLPPSWNAAPTDLLPVVRYDRKAGERSLDLLRWGLVPFWAKDLNVGFANNGSLNRGLKTTTSLASEAYNSALDWKDNAELSRWLTTHLSHQRPTDGSRAMDYAYLHTHIGGGWHRLYDGGHSLSGSWEAVRQALPDLSAFEQCATWANEYWKDFITTRGMPIVTLDHAHQISEYFKHLDCVNVAQGMGGGFIGVSIYCNWNDPAKLMASAASSDCSGFVHANIVAPLVSLIALGRAYYLLKESEQEDLRELIAPALRGLTRSGASVLLITVIPGSFLLHLSSGIVISLAHGYVWEKGSENKEEIFAALKQCLATLEAIPRILGCEGVWV
jgi:hypothetical protein